MKVAAIQMPTVKDKMQNIRTAGTYMGKNKSRTTGLRNPPGNVLLSISDREFPNLCRKRRWSIVAGDV
mgnify:CR=1 FL=1